MKRWTLLVVLLAVTALSGPLHGQVPAEAKSGEVAGEIRFQFDGMPYMDVLERFAQMVNKPLLIDSAIEGTLTFSDPKPYQYTEALDTLNVILAMKEVMMVESGRYLRVVPLKDLARTPLKILKGTDPITDVRPEEVVTVVLALKHLDASEVAAAVRPMLSTAGSIASLSGGQGLVVTDRLVTIRRVQQLLVHIDSESHVERQMKTYTLLHASGAVVADLINRTFGISTAPKRMVMNPKTEKFEELSPDPNSYVTAVYDETSRTLVLFGPKDRIELADGLIKRFEGEEGAQGGDVRIYHPQTTQAANLAAMLRQAMPSIAAEGETGVAATMKVRLITDVAMNRLIVSAPASGQLDAVENLVSRIDGATRDTASSAPSEGAAVATRVLRPQTVDPSTLSMVLTNALSRRTRAGVLESRVTVTMDPATRTLAVTGSMGDVAEAETILAQLESSGPETGERLTRFYAVEEGMDPGPLALLAGQLYTNQVGGAIGEKGAHARIVADPGSRRLIVTATQPHLVMIEAVLKELQAGVPQVAARRLQTVALKHVRVDEILSRVQESVAARMTEPRFREVPAPSLIADAARNRILVTSTEEQFGVIEEVLALLDLAAPGLKRELATLPLKFKKADELIALVTELLGQVDPDPTGTRPAPKLMADPGGKQIIVLAAPSDLARIQELVQRFDIAASPGANRVLRPIEMRSRTVAEVLPLVERLYQEQTKGMPEPAGGAVAFIAEPQANRILVSGSEKEIVRVEEILRQLDPPGSPTTRIQTRVLRLNTAVAAEIAGLVEKSLNATRQQVSVLLDERSNSLVVTGNADAVEEAGRLVEQLDTRPSVRPREMRIFDLKSADAAVLAPMIGELFAEMVKDSRGANYVTATKVVPDTTGNRLIVTGPQDELLEVAVLVEQLDQVGEAAGGARVFKLNTAKASVLAPIISGAMVTYDAQNRPIQRMSISADEKSNSLVVSGARADLQDVEAMIARLDGPATDSSRAFRLIDLQGNAAAEVAATALKVFTSQNPARVEDISITPDGSGRRLVVLAPGNLIAEVEAIITALAMKPAEPSRELHLVEVKNGAVEALLPKVTQVYSERARESTERPATLFSQGRQLAVIGTGEQAAAIQQIVTALEGGAMPVQRETRIVDLGNPVEAERIRGLALQLYASQLKNDPAAGPADAEILADGTSGRLILTGQTTHLEAIEAIVTRLRTGTQVKPLRETRSFEVGTEVERLLPLVQQVYQDQLKDKGASDPADATILPDVRGGRLMVTGRPDHLQQIGQILQSLQSSDGARIVPQETRVYRLKSSSSAELVVTVKALYEEQGRNRPGAATERTLILADAAANRLIVSGLTNEVEVVEGIIRRLDEADAQTGGARVFDLKHARAKEVGLVLSTTLVSFNSSGTPYPRVSVATDQNSNTVIVTGEARDLQAAAVIVEQLDFPGPSVEREVRVLRIGSGGAGPLIDRARQLYLDQVKGGAGADLAEPLILQGEADDQLIVAGTASQIERLKGIIESLETLRPARTARETRMFSVEKPQEVDRVLPLLEQLYRDQWKDRGGTDAADATILGDRDNSRLIVTGRPDHLTALEGILAKLSPEARPVEVRETRVYNLTAASAVELAATVKSIYEEELRSSRTVPFTQSLILPDAAANRLIVSGATNELARLDQIISQLDQVSAQTAGTRVHKLKRSGAVQIATILSTALIDPATGRPRVSVGADDKSNTLIVSGGPADLQSAAVIIEQLDSILEREPRSMTILPIASGTASALALKVRELYLDQMKGRADSGNADALILEDDVSNRLIVTASESQMKLILEIAARLEEAPGAGGRQLRILMLKRNSAAAVTAVVAQFFSKETVKGELLVTASPDDRAVVVDATGRVFEGVEQLVKALDRPEAEGETVLKTVHLKSTQAAGLAQGVSQAILARGPASPAGKVSVTAVGASNSLLINGPSDAVEEVMKIVMELDQEVERGEVEIRIFRLEHGEVREVSRILEQLLRGVDANRARLEGGGSALPASIALDTRSNSMIISGTAVHFRTVEQLLPILDQAPERSERDVEFFWLKNAQAGQVADQVQAVFADRPAGEQPVVEADFLNNSVTVIARHVDLVETRKIIERLDRASLDNSVQIRMLSVSRIPADQMVEMLTNIYPQMTRSRLRVVEKLTPPEQGDPGASTNVLDEVVIAVDMNANALMLLGPSAELDRIDTLVRDLSFSFISSEAEFRQFPLKEADPVVVAKTLTALFKRDPVVVPKAGGTEVVTPAPTITVVPEPLSSSIIVRANPSDFPLLEKLVSQLDAEVVSSQLSFRVVLLEHADPEKVLVLVNSMVTQLGTVRPGEALSVSVDARARGLLLVARDSILDQLEAMIEVLDSPSPFAETEVLIVGLQKANAPQLAAVLQGMLSPVAGGVITPQARELQEQVRRLKVRDDTGQEVQLDLIKPIRIMADPAAAGAAGGNRLILTSTPDNLKALASVVAMMDSAAVVEGVDVRVVPLEHADASTVSTTLTAIFAAGVQMGQGPGGRAQPEGTTGKALVNPLGVAVDLRSNSLILTGQAETLFLASRILADLDQEVARFFTEVKLIPLRHASAVQLAPLLQSVFTEGAPVPGSEGLSAQVSRLRVALEGELPKASEQPRARAALVIQADEPSNTLVVAARKDTLPLIEDVIRGLDVPSASGLDSLRVYPLQHSDALAFKKVLDDLYEGTRVPALRPEDRPRITIDDRTNVLIVTGSSKAFAFVESLLKQLDTELALEMRDLQILPLGNADATSLATTVQQLMDARATQRAATGREAALMKVMVLPEPRSNSLLIAGGKDSFELIQSLVQKLDQAGPALSGQIRMVRLEHADVRNISVSLTALFSQRYALAKNAALQHMRPIIIPDPRSNTLLIAAGVEDNRAVDELLLQLDAKLEDPSMTLTVIGIRHNDATRVAATLQDVFAARQKTRTVPGETPPPEEQVSVSADPLQNALIISAGRDNLELIKGLLLKLDVEPVAAGGSVEAFTLRTADASRVANMLRSLVQQGLYRPGLLKTGPGLAEREAVAVTVDARSNTLIVSASPENLLVIRELIKQVDSDVLAEGADMQLYTLKHVRASHLARVLEQFFRSKRITESTGQGVAERSAGVTITPDDRTNTLLVTGGRESFEAIERMIKQLDTETALAQSSFKVFVLRQATASKLQATLEKLLAKRPSLVEGQLPEPITVVADAWANSLIVGAAMEDLPMVSSLIQQLDVDPGTSEAEIELIPLAKANAQRVAETIQGLYRDGGTGTTTPVSVSVDERINALVVSAGAADRKRIMELAAKLDTDEVSKVSEIRVIALKHARAQSLSTTLNTVLNTKPQSLTEQSPNTQSLLQFISQTEDGRELVASALQERVMITPDVRMNSLIVSAPLDYMSLVESVVRRMDESSPELAKIKVVTLKNADVEMMARVLRELFRLDEVRTPDSNPRSVQYTLVRPALLDAEAESEVASAILGTAEEHALSVTVDPRTNSLLIGGTEHYVSLVAEVVATLDSTEAQERQSEVYRLRNARAIEVEVALRSFLDQDQQRVGRVLGVEGEGSVQRVLEREVAIVAEPISNVLLLSANRVYFDRVRMLIEELDQPQRQVLVQVILAEVTLDDTMELGMEWAYTGAGGGRTYDIGTDFGVADSLTSFGGFFSAVTGSDYSFLLRALESDGRLEVLSRPQILTADNQPASINVGQRVPLVTLSRVTDQGDTINSFTYQDVGVNLTVTPRISPDGFVKMDVGTTNSALSSSNVRVSEGVDAPIINERRATTTVTVQSGQSIMIGGLISTSDDERVRRIPFLGKIPLLGALFRSTTSIHERKELLIILTPQVLSTNRIMGAILDADAMTRDQLDKSPLKDQLERNAIQQQILEPLFPSIPGDREHEE